MIKKFIKQLKNSFGKELISVVLFGSRARKIYNEDSDFDILVILKEKNKIKLSKLKIDFLKENQAKLDLTILNKKDALNNFRASFLFRIDALNNFTHHTPLFSTFLFGFIVLFDKNDFFKNKIKKMAKNMEKEEIFYYKRGKLWSLKEHGIKIMNLP